MIKYVQGDIFNTCDLIIVHMVNCQGSYNAGIAKQIRKLYPLAYAEYMCKFHRFGWYTGDIQYVRDKGKVICNLAGQTFYGGNRDNVDYEGLRMGLEKLIAWAHAPISMPKIGAGLAGGDWGRIEKIIEETSAGFPYDITIYYL